MNVISQKELFLRYLAQTSPEPMGVEIERAEGSKLFGPDGAWYYDLVSGVSVSNIGHSHPSVIKAVSDQAARYMHTMVYGEYIQSPQVRLAEKLASLLPEGIESSYFVNSGSEAIEGALKLARRYTGRPGSVSLRNAYHGSTLGALSLMGDEYFRNSFRPLPPGNMIIDPENYEDLEQIDHSTACVFVEPIMGEAGIRPLSSEYMSALRSKCDESGALLVFDEIQSGFGRTGKMFAMEHYGIIPDIVCLAKGLGGGMPLGAFCSSKEIMQSLTSDPVLGHITTFGGHPVSCAAALATIDIIESEKLAENALRLEHLFHHELQNAPSIKEIRSKGLMMAAELGEAKLNLQLIKELRSNHILSEWFLFCDTAFRISPPLNMKEYEVEESCRLICETIRKL